MWGGGTLVGPEIPLTISACLQEANGNAKSARGKTSGKPIRKNKEEGGKKGGSKSKKRRRSKSKTIRTRYKWVEGTQDLMVAG